MSDLLHCLGGRPHFDEPLHVGRPNIGDRAALFRRLCEMLDRKWITNDGPLVKEFERRIADAAGVEHCIATCNATLALEIAVRAAGMTGEVIVPPFTFVATAHALQWQGITPVFCDIDEPTNTIDPEGIEPLITPRTTGIIGVHLWGHPCKTDALQTIAERHGLTLIYDAAHAFGCTHQGRPVGGFGRAEIFSFHATKIVQSGEGGAVVTNDAEFAARIRRMRNFGFAGYDYVVQLGINAKMNELSAAMGLTSLDSMDDFVAANRRNYESYRESLADISGLTLRRINGSERSNYHYVVVEVDENECGLTRDQLLQVLHSEGVLARRYFYPGVHRMEPYRSCYPDAIARVPVADAVARRVLVLPTGTAVTPEDASVIAQILRSAIEDAPLLLGRLPAHIPPSPTEAAYQS